MHDQPLIFFGHHKCASSWATNVINCIQKVTGYEISHQPGENIAPTKLIVYRNSKYEYVKRYKKFKGFHIIRDPRDIVVSAYFSHLKTHSIELMPVLDELRPKLQNSSIEEGLYIEMDFLQSIFKDLYEWNYDNKDILEYKFEEITSLTDQDFFFEIFNSWDIVAKHQNPFAYSKLYLKSLANKLYNRKVTPQQFKDIKIPEKLLAQYVSRNTFKSLANGRDKNQEDVNSHYRKGIPGDWKNYFSEEHKEYFIEKYDDLLIKLGYEKNNKW